MLIRNAVIDGYPGMIDLRLMHGAVQEIGVGLQKGLYEAELDLGGDLLAPCLPDELPKKYTRRRGREGDAGRIVPGAQEPFIRWRDGQLQGFIDSHSAD